MAVSFLGVVDLSVVDLSCNTDWIWSNIHVRAEASDSEPQAHGGVFATTHWSVVLAAMDTASPEARGALETLCRLYWLPIYAYIRRKGYSPEEAQDLTQEFFTRLLASNGLRNVGPAKGKFRSFLLASVNHLLCDEWDRASRQKRGGGQRVISFDAQTAERRYRLEPADQRTPERIFDRRWATALVEEALRRLEAEYASGGKAEVFSTLKDSLTLMKEEWDYGAAAQRLKLTEGAARIAVHRLRRRFGELFRAAVANTLSDPGELDAEIRYLLAALSD
jgi:DNA-directed RNA polymerase specialized sigma24 family protein